MNFRCVYSHKLSVAITGSTGFIGMGIMRDNFSFSPINVEDVPCNTLFIHLCADLTNTADSLLTNLSLDLRLLEMINAKHKGLIYASSNNIYPFSRNCKTHSNYEIHGFYSASKIFGEQLVEAFIQVPYVLVRIGDVFGVGQRHGNFFKAVEESIRNQTPLKRFGKGLKLRNYIYQPELCLFLLHLAEKIKNNDYLPTRINACFEQAVTINSLLAKLQSLTALEVEQINLDTDHSQLDIRSMVAGPFHDYHFQWPTLDDALLHYVNKITL